MRNENRVGKRIAGTVSLVSLALWLGGCAPMSEIKQAEREYRRADFENQFLDFRRQCVRSGGRVYVMSGGNVNRNGLPSRGDRYTCG